MPISSKALFKKSGMPIDVWEMNLKSEGLLFPNEDLLEVLKDEANLYRGPISDIGDDNDPDFGLIPEDWTEEDYEQLEKDIL